MDLNEQTVRQFTEAAQRVLKPAGKPATDRSPSDLQCNGNVVGRDLHINSHAANDAGTPWWVRLSVATMTTGLIASAIWQQPAMGAARWAAWVGPALCITGSVVLGALIYRIISRGGPFKDA